ncbi:MAG TPA: hypothetical protein VK623_11750 [Flavobacterium sp.]|nr:hypothetical protein [Flavobacterium sp.]
MRNFTIYLSLILCLYLSKMNAQETFEYKARIIAAKIESITKEEKGALKAEVEAVNIQLEKKEITSAQADERKIQLAETRAKNIENRVAEAEVELNQLIKDHVDGKIKGDDSTRTYMFKIKTNRHTKELNGETRTTSQAVFALGANNLVTDGAVANSDFRYAGSHFYEWGFTYNTRILKNNNLLHAKYGMSLMYNNLRPTDNRYFVENGQQTNLETAPINLKDSRFRNVNLVVPVHLEFDFSKKEVKDGKTIFRTHQAMRFGIGGFAGVNIKSKQILKYEDSDNNDVTQKTKGDFNTNDFVYGLSTYIGYKETSLYLKYDLSPLFEDNAIKQNNISLGVRFDFN